MANLPINLLALFLVDFLRINAVSLHILIFFVSYTFEDLNSVFCVFV